MSCLKKWKPIQGEDGIFTFFHRNFPIYTRSKVSSVMNSLSSIVQFQDYQKLGLFLSCLLIVALLCYRFCCFALFRFSTGLFYSKSTTLSWPKTRVEYQIQGRNAGAPRKPGGAQGSCSLSCPPTQKDQPLPPSYTSYPLPPAHQTPCKLHPQPHQQHPAWTGLHTPVSPLGSHF